LRKRPPPEPPTRRPRRIAMARDSASSPIWLLLRDTDRFRRDRPGDAAREARTLGHVDRPGIALRVRPTQHQVGRQSAGGEAAAGQDRASRTDNTCRLDIGAVEATGMRDNLLASNSRLALSPLWPSRSRRASRPRSTLSPTGSARSPRNALWSSGTYVATWSALTLRATRTRRARNAAEAGRIAAGHDRRSQQQRRDRDCQCGSHRSRAEITTVWRLSGSSP
jgi:hypothetical protein